jgi:hypothetical protein
MPQRPEPGNDPNAQTFLNSQGVQTVSTYADITKTGQAKSRAPHTKRPLSATSPTQSNLNLRDHPSAKASPKPTLTSSTHHQMARPHHSFYCDCTHRIHRQSRSDINPDFSIGWRPHTRRIAAANVTRSGNLVIHTKAPYTAAQLKLHTQDIHNNAKAIPGFSPPDDAPLVELDVPWHGLVIHGLPTLSLRDAYYTVKLTMMTRISGTHWKRKPAYCKQKFVIFESSQVVAKGRKKSKVFSL